MGNFQIIDIYKLKKFDWRIVVKRFAGFLKPILL